MEEQNAPMNKKSLIKYGAAALVLAAAAMAMVTVVSIKLEYFRLLSYGSWYFWSRSRSSMFTEMYPSYSTSSASAMRLGEVSKMIS